MCLTIFASKEVNEGKIEPIIADHDIVCYKVLNYNFGGDNSKPFFESIYQYMRIQLGKRYNNRQSADVVVDHEDDDDIEYSVNGGFYHSFEYLTDAIEEMYESCNAAVVVKCIIPKGTEYYYGTFCVADSYASRSIIYTDVIEDYLDWHDKPWGEEDCENDHDCFNEFIAKMDAHGMKYTIGENLQYEIECFRERVERKELDKEEENNNN